MPEVCIKQRLQEGITAACADLKRCPGSNFYTVTAKVAEAMQLNLYDLRSAIGQRTGAIRHEQAQQRKADAAAAKARQQFSLDL